MMEEVVWSFTPAKVTVTQRRNTQLKVTSNTKVLTQKLEKKSKNTHSESQILQK